MQAAPTGTESPLCVTDVLASVTEYVYRGTGPHARVDLDGRNPGTAFAIARLTAGRERSRRPAHLDRCHPPKQMPARCPCSGRHNAARDLCQFGPVRRLLYAPGEQPKMGSLEIETG